MILLRDEIEIGVAPEQVLDWLAHFQENYLAWHPDHLECRYVVGSDLFEVGAVLYVEETLHGELHRLRLRTTKVIPGRRVEYRGQFGIGGVFEVRPLNGGTLFVAELTLGLGLRALDRLVDRILQRLLPAQIEGLRQHMAEEGRNLKKWLEEGAPQPTG
jgi:hypothetical protein